jgi:aldehyde:ferredoxin oxidoreductase
MKGYAGKVLHVDLSNCTFEVENPGESFYRTYIGGSCLGAYYVMKGMKKGIEALSPESVLVFSIGPLAGSTISGSARHAVTGKSPQTGGIMASEGGGYWAPELKWAGFDAIVIKGKAKKPVYLWIHDGEFQLRDAGNIWGKTTKDAQSTIREELGDSRIRVAQIGVAGETLCNYANIVNELGHFNGRGGLGAVMGSKMLRAIAVRGTAKPDYYDRDSIMALAKKGVQTIKNSEGLQGFRVFGTNNCVDEHIGLGGLPTKNWSSGTFTHENDLTPAAWNEAIIEPGTCYACAQSCKRHVDGKKTNLVDPSYGGPEYETVGMLGSNLCISDKVAICQINEICAKYAFDTISFGGTVGFIMECFEKGILNESDTGGLSITFGNIDAVVKLAEMTGKSEGFGKFVAEGSAYMAKKIGKGSEKLLITVKNKELPAHMPQAKGSLGLAYALVPYGADHVSGQMDPTLGVMPLPYQMQGLGFDRAVDPSQMNSEKAKLFWRTQMAYSMMDTASVCLLTFSFWTAYDLDDLVSGINAATGWKMNLYELMMVGERRLQMMRAYNVLEGFTSEDDVLPEKLFIPLEGGITDGIAMDKDAFFKAREFYYELAGWTAEGNAPSTARLLLLNLDWVVDYLESDNKVIGY